MNKKASTPQYAAMVAISCLGFTVACTSALEAPDNGNYLNQPTPDVEPKPFAPDLVSTSQWSDTGYFSPDMQTFYLTRFQQGGVNPTSSVYQKQGENWQETSVRYDARPVAFSQDGNTRIVGTKVQQRTNNGWSELRSLGQAFTDIGIQSLSISNAGTLVMDEAASDEGKVVMRYSKLVNGSRELPQPLPRGVNAGKHNANPFIAPDESYLLWDGERRSGYGQSDLYVSFKQANGTWSEAFNLGDSINTAGAESRPQVSPDGKYLFFNRMIAAADGMGAPQLDLYWVDAKVIEDLRLRQHDNIAPEATAKEAPIVYWSVPDIKRHFFHLPPLAQPYIATAPTNRNDGFVLGELGKDGGNKTLLLQTVKEIAENPNNEIDSIIAVKNGKLIFESYFARGRIDLSHPQSSAVKSYTSMAVGRAIQLGYLSIEDLDKPIASFFDELNPTNFASGTERLTLRRALTMRTGLRIDDATTKMLHANPDMIKEHKEVQQLFERTEPIDSAKETEFAYGNFSSQLVMQVINAVAPHGAEQFLREEFLGKLGITNYAWRVAPAGIPEGGWRMSMTSRDMAKIGTVALNKGKWNGQQFISEAFLTQALSRQVPLTDEQVERFYTGENLTNPGYGFFWWLMDMQAGDQDRVIHSKSVQGGGGMTVQVIEELDLVLVITAHSPYSYSQFVAEKLLPAFIDS